MQNLHPALLHFLNKNVIRSGEHIGMKLCLFKHETGSNVACLSVSMFIVFATVGNVKLNSLK